MCESIKIDASSEDGRPAARVLIASKPPADAPITIMFLLFIAE
jgi:hypothetical protein